MTDERLVALSQEFQVRNGLDPVTRDPYRQMVSGDSEPRDFDWVLATTRLGPRAVELISTGELEAGDLPSNVTRASLIRFGLTFDAYLHHGPAEAAKHARERIASRLAKTSRGPDIDELRTWLYFEAARARDDENEIDLRGVKRVLTALRRELASPRRGALKITPKRARRRSSNSATAPRATSRSSTRMT